MIAVLLNHLWQSTLFVLAATITAAALRKNSAHIRHGVWVIAALKFLAPFSLLMSLGSALPSFTPAAAAIADTTTAAAPALPLTVDRFAQPFTGDDFVSTITIRATASTTNWMPMVLLAIWAIGLLAVAWTRLRGWQRIRALVRQSTPVALRSPIPVRSSPGSLEPGVVGIWSSVLLMPAGIEQRLTPSQFDAVFAHELCHVHRRDNLTAAIHMVVETVFWFHPLVWWIGARLVEERERACDEYVLRAFGEPQTYAESILNVCKLYVESPLPCVSGVSGSDLKKRVAAIMVNHIGTRLNLARKTALTLAAILAIALPLIVGMLTPAIRASSPQEPVVFVARPQTRPSFEAASIKLAPNCDATRPARFLHDRIILPCTTLRALIRNAYTPFSGGRLPATRIEVLGLPSWTEKDTYNVEAKAESNASLAQMLGPMLQALLEDRFQLKVHKEFRNKPVYELTVAKSNPNMRPSKKGSCIPRDDNSIIAGSANPAEMFKTRYCGIAPFTSKGSTWSTDWYGVSMSELADMLQIARLDRTVIDRTGLTGRFDFHLEFVRERTSSGVVTLNGVPVPADSIPSVDAMGPSIFTALKEQLGLRLSPANGQVAVLVIDRVEKLSPN